MAVHVYLKNEEGDIEGLLVEPSRLQSFLSSGYKLTPEECETVEAPTFEEADTNNSGALSNDEVREAAKEAGLEDWETARIKTLKGKLGYDSN